MRHPFDGPGATPDAGVTRRAALGALAGLGLCGAAAAQEIRLQVVTDAVNERGIATTLAVGEEGGPGAKAAPVTTEPFGEEAGKVVSRATPGLEDGAAAEVTKAANEAGGPIATTQALGEEGAATGALNENGIATRALNEEGRFTTALNEAGGPGGGVIVPVKPNTKELKPEQLKQVWADLASKDAAVGVQACAVLYGAKGAEKFLAETFKAAKVPGGEPPNEQAVARLIEALDANEFAAREQAEKELAQMGPGVLPAVQAAVKVAKSAEQRMRLERILEAAKEPAEWAQARRGLEVLVALKTPESKAVLEELTKGPAKAWLTGQAKEALERASK